MKMTKARKNEPLAKFTTFRIGGPAELFLMPETVEELADFCGKYPEGFILGGGSNVLVSDEGAPVVIFLKKLKNFSVAAPENGSSAVTAGSGYSFTALSRKMCGMGLSGLEFAYGIPGTVGGAVVMNAGASGGEVKDVLEKATLLVDGKVRDFSGRELGLSYRKSELPKGAVIVSATFNLQQGDEKEIERRMKENLEKRKQTQPLDIPSAGSVFRNPPGDFAGRIIESLGFKGRCVGGAQVSEKHANFIVNQGWATAAQVFQLIKMIEETVKSGTGITLEREIKLVGNF